MCLGIGTLLNLLLKVFHWSSGPLSMLRYCNMSEDRFKSAKLWGQLHYETIITDFVDFLLHRVWGQNLRSNRRRKMSKNPWWFRWDAAVGTSLCIGASQASQISVQGMTLNSTAHRLLQNDYAWSWTFPIGRVTSCRIARLHQLHHNRWNVLFDRVSVRILTSGFHHQTPQKKKPQLQYPRWNII